MLRKSEGTTCNPCAYTIAYLFAKYETHVEMAIEEIFTEISKRIASVLLEAKRDASGEHDSERVQLKL